MIKLADEADEPGRAGGRAVRSLSAAAAVMLIGCGAVPDRVNPFAEPKPVEQGSILDTSKVPGGEDPFPNLADVPDRPSYRLTEEQRQRTVEGLVADRDNASLSDRPVVGPEAEAAAAKAAALKQRIEVEPVPPFGSKLATIGFAAGSADLPPDAIEVIWRVAEAHKASGGRVRIVGHATGGGGPDVVALSAERARVIAEELVRRGVSSLVIETDARGDTEPVAPSSPDAGVGPDRAEIFLEA